MTVEQILFLLFAALTLAAGFMVVTVRNLVRAALWLVATLFLVAIVFVFLNANFLAVVQVVIYIGAIAILFIFAVMLTRRVMQDSGPQTNANWWLPALFSLVLFAGLAWMTLSWPGAGAQPPAIPADFDAVSELGVALVNPEAFVIPFELASVLLLAALIGAVLIAWDKPSS